MRTSRRDLLRAGASTGLLALLGCGGGGVRSAGAVQNGSAAAGSAPIVLGTLPIETVRTSVGMVGDSITKASSKALTAAAELQGFSEITIEAEVSRRIVEGTGKGTPLSGVKTLYTMLAEGVDPDVWVVALGTNDVGKYKGADEYAALIDRLMTMPPRDVPIVWVDVYNPKQLDDTAMFNLVLRQRAVARGNATVVSWYELASPPTAKILRSDKIHPNENGTLAFADLVAGALG